MNFGFSEEQDMLRQSVRRFLQKKCPIPEVSRLRKFLFSFQICSIVDESALSCCREHVISQVWRRQGWFAVETG